MQIKNIKNTHSINTQQNITDKDFTKFFLKWMPSKIIKFGEEMKISKIFITESKCGALD